MTGLSRGTIAVDARIDLHGMTQEAAHHRLRVFLQRQQAADGRLVLVITGKGRPDDDRMLSERGVLRRAVPEWLGSPGFRDLVSAYNEAGRRHGGAGALYVRLKRKKP
jgi:DNA-nicking Smr family endonuclease